uniref:Uncharacterized protein n=1 Tax=Ascaris lumbricoides TaxID=6252 RepID=A0A0M3I5Z4_ASCLU
MEDVSAEVVLSLLSASRTNCWIGGLFGSHSVLLNTVAMSLIAIKVSRRESFMSKNCV